MNNPRVTAVISAAVAAWLVYSMATATEGPDLALAVLQYVLIAGALIGLVGSLIKMTKPNIQS